MNFFSIQREKGRGWKLKLNAARVRAIRLDLANGMTQKKAAAKHHVSKSTIGAVNIGTVWGWV